MADYYERIVERDKGRCVRCGNVGAEIHHLVPRSHFGKAGRGLRDSDLNLAVVCKACHQNRYSAEIAKKLHQRHGYDYSIDPRLEWLINA
jgi:5-methylcytosine-specific restriction endonuclease McrA